MIAVEERYGRTVVAMPVAPHEAVQSLAGQVDDMVCLLLPDEVASVDFYYADFKPPTDDEVIELLRKCSNSVDGTLPDGARRINPTMRRRLGMTA
ncbi:MAG TPA: hypothetical protein VN639_13520 [Azonexus sp.]|nr:hypothetical protein [Azonexus sp.]